MRRRQVYASIARADQSVEAYQEPKPKGVCKKCSKKIGKGVHFHERSCKG